MGRRTIHIFNPGHEFALAENKSYVTLPRAAQQLQNDLAFLPALWAKADDFVLVNHAHYAQIPSDLHPYVKCSNFITPSEISSLPLDDVQFKPWGWDKPLCQQLILLLSEKSERLLPSEDTLDVLRKMSSRQWTARYLLPTIVMQNDNLVGWAHAFDHVQDVLAVMDNASQNSPYQFVLKAPWSSSGRGLRYVDVHGEGITEHLKGWIKNVIRRQGCVMLEPFYQKVCDFGMEFYAHSNSDVSYMGLSLFNTTNGIYTGNCLASEREKIKLLTKHVRLECLETIRQQIQSVMRIQLHGNYVGPFGVDMMALPDGKVHPCVELNLRRTMGHVALDISKKIAEPGMMRILFQSGRYALHITHDDKVHLL